MFAKTSLVPAFSHVLTSVLMIGLLGLGSAHPLIAQETQLRAPRGQAQVVARGGFPDLAPRSAEATKRFGAADAASGSAYRISGGSITSGNRDQGIEGADSVHDRSDSGTAAAAVDRVVDDLALPPEPESSRSKMFAPLVTVTSSLAIVLALFSGLVWVSRKFGGASATSKPIPASALQPLGHIMLDPRTKLMLIKCGRRILVVSQTASGLTPITEVTDPEEVRELIACCSAEAREVFERTLRQIELEPARGFTESYPSEKAGTKDVAPAGGRPSGRLFASA